MWPFWSPDGKSLGFFARGKLRRVDLAGGPARIIADAPLPWGGTWSRDGIIVFAPNLASPLMRVTGCGRHADTDYGIRTTHRRPRRTFFLPDGRHVLFTARSGARAGNAMVVSLDSAEVKPVLSGV